MAKRIVSGVIGLALFFAVLYFLPHVCFTAAVALICAVASYELTWRSGIVSSRALSAVACVFAFCAPFLVSSQSSGIPVLADISAKLVFVLIFLCIAALFSIWLANSRKITLVMVLTSFFAGVILPIMFSTVLLIRGMENGEYLLLVPFIAAWMTDTGAYFIGMACGKTKLCAYVSPKKTVEGAIGGVVSCVAALLVFGLIMHNNLGVSVNYLAIAIMAVILSCIAQMGDLSFSLIKREYNIKDYGNVLPGHGGVLDRFDSVMFTIPAAYILIRIVGGIL